jgi:hypothetical protein
VARWRVCPFKKRRICLSTYDRARSANDRRATDSASKCRMATTARSLGGAGSRSWCGSGRRGTRPAAVDCRYSVRGSSQLRLAGPLQISGIAARHGHQCCNARSGNALLSKSIDRSDSLSQLHGFANTKVGLKLITH